MVGVINDEHETLPTLIPLDDLVARAVSPDMLEDEPEAARLLREFLRRIERSRESVMKALGQFKAG
jgi:hypothetical protein